MTPRSQQPEWGVPAMRPNKTTLLVGAMVVFSVCPITNADLIVNGSFEVPQLTEAWTNLDDIPGWIGGIGGVEVQADSEGSANARAIASGEQFVELDTYRNSSMFQHVPTNAGAVYELVFAYAPRNSHRNRPIDSNDVEVRWEGNRVALMSGPTSPELFSEETWTIHSFQVTATSNTGSSRLQFTALGTSDSAGGLIDRVCLTQIPEPSSMLLLTLVGLACLRSCRWSCCVPATTC